MSKRKIAVGRLAKGLKLQKKSAIPENRFHDESDKVGVCGYPQCSATAFSFTSANYVNKCGTCSCPLLKPCPAQPCEFWFVQNATVTDGQIIKHLETHVENDEGAKRMHDSYKDRQTKAKRVKSKANKTSDASPSKRAKTEASGEEEEEEEEEEKSEKKAVPEVPEAKQSEMSNSIREQIVARLVHVIPTMSGSEIAQLAKIYEPIRP